MHRRAKKDKRSRYSPRVAAIREPDHPARRRLYRRLGANYAEVLLGVGLVALMTIFFVAVYDTSPWVAVASLPIALPAVVILVLLDKSLPGFFRGIRNRIGALWTVFFTFFASLVGGVLIFLLLLGQPMALVFNGLGLEELVHHYERWAANSGMAGALAIWLRCSLRITYIRQGRW
ncbi:MAG: hypothetical protein R6W72_13355 [Desulfurivibrionaceae bacterium]